MNVIGITETTFTA